MDNTTEKSQNVMSTSRISNSNYGNPIEDSTLSVVEKEIDINHNQNNINDNKNNIPENPLYNKTYIEIIAEKDSQGQPLSVLEVDLIISREKGKETRRLCMNFAGIDMEKKEMIEKSINIDRESFEQLKEFFSNLDWNS